MTKRKASGEPLYIAPDTDVLLHFKRPDTIDWGTLAPGRRITLIFVSNTLRELEQHKDGVKAGRRDVARDVNSWLRRTRKGEANTQGCQVTLHPVEPTDFSGGLDPSTGDDRFVASLRDLASEGKDVMAYTNDFLCQTKLERMGLAYIEPRAEDARAPIRDEYDERLKRLEKAVASKPTPKFGLDWSSGGCTRSIAFAPIKQIVDVDVEALELPEFLPTENGFSGMCEARLSNPARIGGPTQQGLIRTSTQRGSAYNDERRKYLREYSVFISNERLRLSNRSRIIKLSFRLTNVGAAPASNVRVQATLPDGVWIPDERPPEGRQGEPPSPPNLPSGNNLYRVPPRFVKEMDFGYYNHHDQSPVLLKRLSSQIMEARRDNLQHGDCWITSELSVIVEERLGGTEVAIAFHVWADELPEPARPDLTLVIQPRT